MAGHQLRIKENLVKDIQDLPYLENYDINEKIMYLLMEKVKEERLKIIRLNNNNTKGENKISINGISEKFTQKPNISFLELFPKYSI